MASKSFTLQAPTGGWNVKDPISMMPPEDARELVNYFPGQSEVGIRGGYAGFCTSGIGSGSVSTLASYVRADGAKNLLAGTNSRIYTISTSGVATSQGSGFTSDKWQWINFRDSSAVSKAIFVNGSDTPQYWNGTALAANVWTGYATPADFISISSYKNRIYVIPKNSTSLYYGGAFESSGVLTEFPVGALFQRGGYVLFAGSWTKNSGTSTSDAFVVVSSEGEILVYEGEDPSDTAWTTTGRFFVPEPLGRRAFIQQNNDLYIHTKSGIAALSKVIATNNQLDFSSITVSTKIDPYLISMSESYGTNFGWQPMMDDNRNYMLFNIPTVEGSTATQAVLNTLTGAWALYTGLNAATWVLHDGEMYFGSQTGGQIYLFNSGQNDNNAAIFTRLKTAFNYCGNPVVNKRFMQFRPVLRSNNISTQFVSYIDTDFSNSMSTDTLTSIGGAGSPWDTSPWDTSAWDSTSTRSREWYSVAGYGRCCSVVLEGSFLDYSFSLASFNINFEEGGVI